MDRANDPHALALLLARGGDPAEIERIVASGLPVAVALRAVEATGLLSRLRRRLRPQSPLSPSERQCLQAVAKIAAEVDDMEGGADNASRFWHQPMPWLGDKTPAEALVRRDGLGVIDDLINRIKYGIYS
jgi:putative toxin-antitoxin system antitoxin component (TIGR02293 family)